MPGTTSEAINRSSYNLYLNSRNWNIRLYMNDTAPQWINVTYGRQVLSVENGNEVVVNRGWVKSLNESEWKDRNKIDALLTKAVTNPNYLLEYRRHEIGKPVFPSSPIPPRKSIPPPKGGYYPSNNTYREGGP